MGMGAVWRGAYQEAQALDVVREAAVDVFVDLQRGGIVAGAPVAGRQHHAPLDLVRLHRGGALEIP
jgi:hypothetical protein